MHFLEAKCLNSDWDFIEVCLQRSNQQYSSIDSDNGLASTRQQAIIWANVGLIADACMRHSVMMDTSSAAPNAHFAGVYQVSHIYSLTHWPLGDCNVISKNAIFNLALLIGILKSSYDNVFRWMPQDLTDDKSTMVQVMAWCRQATSHYLNQRWPRSPTPYGVTRPQWVKMLYSKYCGTDKIPDILLTIFPNKLAW